LAPSPVPTFEICSPLAGIPLQQLSALIVNPFHPPVAGSDDPHQGIDLAVTGQGNAIALEGNGVQALMSGHVASVIADRFPYGNAVIIETRWQDLPPAWRQQLSSSSPAHAPSGHSALTCPPAPTPQWDEKQRSLYLLYAHMQAEPDLQIGEAVACAQALGAVGSSGNALNPHLHLEARLGPPEVYFSSLAHYDASATPLEMANYCTWRVSGYFQAIDPLQLLEEENLIGGK
jgi:murein DD-endopeptidase MepM/ murein hydrolase activator NlpD